MDHENLLAGIYQAIKEMDVKDAKAYFKEQQHTNPALQELTIQDLAAHWLHADAMERVNQLNSHIPTGEDLWRAVCAWDPDPLKSPPREKLHAIFNLISSRRFAPVPLGKLRGEIMCTLEPEVCLAPELDSYYPTRQGFGLSDSNNDITRAIRYADGHPPESMYGLKHTATEDPRRTLRRFVSLGYVIMMIDDNWVKTGHALVLDADYGMKCHPWLVLSAKWLTDDECYVLEHETEFKKPAKKVLRDDSEALGVIPLPGHRNRTPIARLTHYGGKEERPEKFVTHFGEDFCFDFASMGQEQEDVTSPWGPDLVEIMNWWWDTVKEEEVCYTQAGAEYLRYNPATRRYQEPESVPRDEVGNIIEPLRDLSVDETPHEVGLAEADLGLSDLSGSSHGHGASGTSSADLKG